MRGTRAPNNIPREVGTPIAKSMASKRRAKAGADRVFISSTAKDLEPFREAAKDAALHLGLLPVMHDYWEGRDEPPYAECMKRVAQCGVLIVIVAKRYGWEPPDQPTPLDGERKSITWLECEKAKELEIPIIPFLLGDTVTWNPELDESMSLLKEAADDLDIESEEFRKAASRSKRVRQRLAAFRQWLEDGRQRRLFTDAASLQKEIILALNSWRAERAPARSRSAPNNPAKASIGADYLDWVRRECGSVELLGLDSKHARAPSISSVYVPALTRARSIETPHDRSAPELEPVLHRLAEHSIYVEGSAGAGKSTFCKWIAWLVANGSLPPIAAQVPEPYREHFPDSLRNHVPVLIRLRDAVEHVCGAAGVRRWTQKQLEDALARWADGTTAAERRLDGRALRTLLEDGRALLIFDGVDELAVSLGQSPKSVHPRETLLSGLADAQADWQSRGNRILLTSRPDSIPPETLHGLGLESAALAPLPEELQTLFVQRWFAATHPEKAQEKAAGMMHDVGARSELRDLSDNPILLTALCICYSDGEKLPEDQFHLYDRVVNGVLAHRYPEGSSEGGTVRRRLAAIAWGMHTGSEAAQPRTTPSAEVTHAELESVLRTFAGENLATEGAESAAAEKLAELLARSGLLVDRQGKRAAFYHLSFQEFLAAERLTRYHDPELIAAFRSRGITAEWRRTLVHLFGALAFRYRDAQWAVNRLTEFAREQSRALVKQNPNPALMLADCIDIACAKGWHLGALTEVFRDLCLHAIADQIAVPARARLALTLSRLGDPRPGVGLSSDGLPDIVWTEVPAGVVQIEQKRKKVAAFAIARYPITNIQYQVFLDAEDGHRDSRWWQGLERREPSVTRWSEDNCPRIGVDWYEATAYCRWLTHRSKRDVRLPSEAEWQLAATGGDSTREYPWGSWEPDRCNSFEAALGRTCSVGLFENGTRIGGALDLAGNVLEWCDDVLGSSDRVVRGGSWIAPAPRCRSAYRHGGRAGDRFAVVGFRPASSSLG